MRRPLLLLFLALAACAPVTTPSPPSSPPAAEPPSAVPSHASAATPSPSAVGLNPGEPAQPADIDAPIPDLVWDPDATNPIILGTFCCGFTTAAFVTNYVPEFQIWANGRYLWVQHNEDGSRQVLESRLSEEQISDLLQRAADAGFFGWNDRYANDSVADLADQCLTIRLQQTEKQVCEYYEGAPPAFHEIYADLASGLGLEGRPVFPTRGFLQLQVLDVDFVTPDLIWENEPLRLSQIDERGAWVGGESLFHLWEALNQKPWGPVVQEGDVYYLFTLRIDGITLEAPPTP